MITTLLVAGLILTVLGAAFCAGTETGIVSVSRPRVMSLERQKGREARRAHHLAKVLADTSLAINTLLIGNNLCAVGFSTISAALSLYWFAASPVWVRSGWSLATAILMLFVGEYLPKLFFATRPLRRTLRVIVAYRTMAFILRPLALLFSAVVDMLFHTVRTKRRRLTLSRDGLRLLVAAPKDSTQLTQFERRLIDRVLMLQASTAATMAHPLEPSAPTPTLHIPASTRGDDILPLMRRAHVPVAAVVAPDQSILGVVTEEDVLLALTGVLKEETDNG